MEIPQETDDYIRASIDHSVGLNVSTDALLLKLRAVEASQVHLRRQYLSLQSKLKEKDETIDVLQAEASMNAVALKKFVEENQKLAMECSNLLAACNKWERECSLYDHDREALMDFANEADERAKEAEVRSRDLEEEKKILEEELHLYKCQVPAVGSSRLTALHLPPAITNLYLSHCQSYMKNCVLVHCAQVQYKVPMSVNLPFLVSLSSPECSFCVGNTPSPILEHSLPITMVGESTNDTEEEHHLLNSLFNTMFGKDEIVSTAHGFLEAHTGIEVCNKLLTLWTRLSPLTQKVVALAAKVKNLEEDKDHLTINLHTAEEEVNALFEENNVLNKENKRLMRQCYREKHNSGSSGGTTSGKGKRKCSPKMSSSPVEKKIDSSDVNMLRQPLSPLQFNSPESRMHKK
ncbi:uncharacterized protein LOC130993815 [Salvia miltiorrhiza]|uniref:uncharacterized protein LOC130993815 n=1 Tax=Salvia miltiorrhiza TaxID=226208 RepID=UPI0025AC2E6F|nr:uncharacterized protein LOC130993815 [Salvia miltiorrhiza]